MASALRRRAANVLRVRRCKPLVVSGSTPRLQNVVTDGLRFRLVDAKGQARTRAEKKTRRPYVFGAGSRPARLPDRKRAAGQRQAHVRGALGLRRRGCCCERVGASAARPALAARLTLRAASGADGQQAARQGVHQAHGLPGGHPRAHREGVTRPRPH